MPPQESPPAKVTACSSAMPTSKNRSGNFLEKESNPVPFAMAAVMQAIFSFLFPSSTILFEKFSVKLRLSNFSTTPSLVLKGPTPWNAAGLFSAGEYPLPFLVTT